jgi:accessory gene regulator protein AgrB
MRLKMDVHPENKTRKGDEGEIFVGSIFISVGFSLLSLYLLTFLYETFIFNNIVFLAFFISSFILSGIIAFLPAKNYYTRSLNTYVKFFIALITANLIAYVLIFKTPIGTSFIILAFLMDMVLLSPLLFRQHN